MRKAGPRIGTAERRALSLGQRFRLSSIQRAHYLSDGQHGSQACHGPSSCSALRSRRPLKQCDIASSSVNTVGSQIPHEAEFEAGTISHQEERPSALTLQALRGIVPAIPGQTSSDFEDEIEEAMEEEAVRIIEQRRSANGFRSPGWSVDSARALPDLVKATTNPASLAAQLACTNACRCDRNDTTSCHTAGGTRTSVNETFNQFEVDLIRRVED